MNLGILGLFKYADFVLVSAGDFQVTETVRNSMFGDTTHLNRYQGAVAFTHLLIEEYEDLLR